VGCCGPLIAFDQRLRLKMSWFGFWTGAGSLGVGLEDWARDLGLFGPKISSKIGPAFK